MPPACLPACPQAAAGGTTHVMDLAAGGRVVQHIERWDIEPGKVVRQLLRPAAKEPRNAWERAFLSASNLLGPGSGTPKP